MASMLVIFIADFPIAHAFTPGSGDWTFAVSKNAVDPHPSLRATLSHKERESNQWGLWLKLTFHARPLLLCHETPVCSFEVSALIRGSLPRLSGEGGPPSGGPGEGRPTGIASQNVQTLGPGVYAWVRMSRSYPKPF